MKKTIFIGSFAIMLSAMFASCNNETNEGKQKSAWEYKIVKVDGKEAKNSSGKKPKQFEDQTAMLNKLGNEGWELVSIYTEEETVFTPLSGISGIENHRTNALNYVFKRQTDSDKSQEK